MACDHEWELPAMPSSVSRCVEVDKIGTTGCSDMMKTESDFVELARMGCCPIERQAGDLQIERCDGRGITLLGKRRWWPKNTQCHADAACHQSSNKVESVRPYATGGVRTHKDVADWLHQPWRHASSRSRRGLG
jgi:hypothetical protein